MAKRKRHTDVEFAVRVNGDEKAFRTIEEASVAAIAEALVGGQGRSVIDVLVHSEAGARFYAGDDGVVVYRDDPETSVFDRIEVRAHSVGRVP